MRRGTKNGYLRGKKRAIERESAAKNPSHFDSVKKVQILPQPSESSSESKKEFVHAYTHVNITYKQQRRFADLRVYCRERESYHSTGSF